MTSVGFNWNRSGGEVPGMDIFWLVVAIALGVAVGLVFLVRYLS